MKGYVAVFFLTLSLRTQSFGSEHTLGLKFQNENPDQGDAFTNVFTVSFDGPEEEIHDYASEHNFDILGKLEFEDETVYELEHEGVEHRSKRSADSHVDLLKNHPLVRRVEQQVLLIRDKRGYPDDSGLDIRAADDESVIVHDKQNDFEIQKVQDKSVYQRFYKNEGELERRGGIPQAKRKMDFNDPAYPDQWYLENTGQAGGPTNAHMNVIPAWKKGFTGQGVVLCVLDDGIQHSHPDLKDNYLAEASADFNDKNDTENDPTPSREPGNSHGTRCAGEIVAVANNNVCGVGIAYEAKIGGVRLLDGKVYDSMEGRGLLFKNQLIHIYSASWGPRDNGMTMEGPHPYTLKGLRKGIAEGRGGKGSIFVWATGNGGADIIGDDCGADGYVGSIYTLSVGSINNYAMSTYYMETCPSTLATVYVGGAHKINEINRRHPLLKIVTTDVRFSSMDDGCIENFQGTSAAAPMAAGCIALALQANMELTWRDVQHIVIEGTDIPNNKESGWTVNGAGKHVNDKFGFGVMNCGAMVELAQTWTNVPPQHVCQSTTKKENKKIPVGGEMEVSMTLGGCPRNNSAVVESLEHVEVYVIITHPRRGDLTLTLVSPAGTESEVLSRRHKDGFPNINFTFMTVHKWGENPTGKWILKVKDEPTDKTRKAGVIKSWYVRLYGTTLIKHRRKSNVKQNEQAVVPTKLQVGKIMNIEEDLRSNSQIVSKGDKAGLERKKKEKKLDDTINTVLHDVEKGDISRSSLEKVLRTLSPAAQKIFKKKLEEYQDEREIFEPPPVPGTKYGPPKKSPPLDTWEDDHNDIYSRLEHLLNKKSHSEQQDVLTDSEKRDFRKIWDDI